MAEVGTGTSLLLFRYAEKVADMKQRMIQLWPEIPAGAMVFFGSEVLASGVVLWALINHTGLEAMRWPGELPTVLGLKLALDSDTKIGEALEMVSGSMGLVGTQLDQLQTTFLEMLQWEVVEQLHASLFAGQRTELAQVLAGYDLSMQNRSEVLAKMSDFLGKSQINTFAAKNFFEQALKRSLWETLEIFKDSIESGKLLEMKKIIGLAE